MTRNSRPVAELVGQDIAGLRANVVQPAYRYQFENCPANMVKTLIRAEYRTQQGQRWLYLVWQKDPTAAGDCGYSGWAVDYHTGHNSLPIIEVVQ